MFEDIGVDLSESIVDMKLDSTEGRAPKLVTKRKQPDSSKLPTHQKKPRLLDTTKRLDFTPGENLPDCVPQSLIIPCKILPSRAFDVNLRTHPNRDRHNA